MLTNEYFGRRRSINGRVPSEAGQPVDGRELDLRCLPVELTAPGTALEVEVLGARVPCRVVSMPLYRRTA